MELKDFIGKTPSSVIQQGDAEIVFEFTDGTAFCLNHSQNCCESVYIESVVGDWTDLIGHPLLVCEETGGVIPANHEPHDGSETWTFYKFAGIKGYVDVRWYGSSNGYYSERVDLETRAGADAEWSSQW